MHYVYLVLASVAEWSKAVDSSSTLFGGVGSNPTGCKYIIFALFYTKLVCKFIWM